MKLNKRILGLETHTYSPEQNTLVFTTGQRLRVPSCMTIKQAKRLTKQERKQAYLARKKRKNPQKKNWEV